MSQTVQTPSGTILEEIELGGYGAFPDQLYVISVALLQAYRSSPTLPDGQNADGLATFPDPDEATTYMGLLAGLSGEIKPVKFEDAREIVKRKPRLSCLFLFLGGRIVEVHYVK